MTATTIEAGAWQVSANSMGFGQELKDLVLAKVGSTDGTEFQKAMKQNHPLGMEYIARLLRRTVNHNGPLIATRLTPGSAKTLSPNFSRCYEKRLGGDRQAPNRASPPVSERHRRAQPTSIAPSNLPLPLPQSNQLST